MFGSFREAYRKLALQSVGLPRSEPPLSINTGYAPAKSLSRENTWPGDLATDHAAVHATHIHHSRTYIVSAEVLFIFLALVVSYVSCLIPSTIPLARPTVVDQ